MLIIMEKLSETVDFSRRNQIRGRIARNWQLIKYGVDVERGGGGGFIISKYN